MGKKLHVVTGQKISAKVKVRSAQQAGIEFIRGIVMGVEDDSIYIEQQLSYSAEPKPEHASKSIIRLFSFRQVEIIALS